MSRRQQCPNGHGGMIRDGRTGLWFCSVCGDPPHKDAATTDPRPPRAGETTETEIAAGTNSPKGWPVMPLPDATPAPVAPGEGETERVAQEDPTGCGIACLAMVSGRTYADVRAEVPEAQVVHGLADQTLIWWLHRHGYWHRRSWPDGEYGKPVPTRGLALALTHDAHWIVLRDGTVLDPARATPLSDYNIRQVIEVLRPGALAASESARQAAEQRAETAERERAKQEYDTTWWQKHAEALDAKLTALRTRLAAVEGERDEARRMTEHAEEQRAKLAAERAAVMEAAGVQRDDEDGTYYVTGKLAAVGADTLPEAVALAREMPEHSWYKHVHAADAARTPTPGGEDAT